MNWEILNQERSEFSEYLEDQNRDIKTIGISLPSVKNYSWFLPSENLNIHNFGSLSKRQEKCQKFDENCAHPVRSKRSGFQVYKRPQNFAAWNSLNCEVRRMPLSGCSQNIVKATPVSSESIFNYFKITKHQNYGDEFLSDQPGTQSESDSKSEQKLKSSNQMMPGVRKRWFSPKFIIEKVQRKKQPTPVQNFLDSKELSEYTSEDWDNLEKVFKIEKIRRYRSPSYTFDSDKPWKIFKVEKVRRGIMNTPNKVKVENENVS